MVLGAVAAAALIGGSAFSASAADAVKIGLILPMTGGQASTGKQIDHAVKLYMKQHGDTVAGKKIEVIRRTSAASRRRSPSGSPRSWWCATRSTSSPASC
jgi:branched-chain amino acid transport system substrate-binding protein